jgi:hypothetical protein
MLKPGQMYWLHNHLFRILKKKDGCSGCIFEDNIIMCPGVEIKGHKKLDCTENNIILVDFNKKSQR